MASRFFGGRSSSRKATDKGKSVAGESSYSSLPPLPPPAPAPTPAPAYAFNLEDEPIDLDDIPIDFNVDDVAAALGENAAAAYAAQNFENEEEERRPTQESENRSRRGPSRAPSGSMDTHGHGQREHRSSIFAIHFTKTEIPGSVPPVYNVQCNYCPKNYKFNHGGGYGTFTKHLNTKHPNKVGLDEHQTQFRGYTSSSQGTDSSTPTLFTYSEATCRRNMAKFVSVKHLPFNFADDEFYEEFAQMSFQPQARKISRSTLTRDIAKVVGEYKLVMIENFDKLQQKVSICSDVWGDHWQTNHYMGITCHWIDDSWTMQKRLIAYREFNTNHTATNIAHKIISILQEYHLGQKIFSVSFDNASANKASLPRLIEYCKPTCGGKFFHIRCMCHCLNLCVQDGLENFKEQVAPIREAVNYISRHSTVTKKWVKFCKQRHRHPKKFSFDVPHRWNSTYKMLNESYGYKEDLCAFFQQNQVGIILFPNQWDACANLISLLKCFEDATKELSGCYYPTSPFVLDHCVKIAFIFASFREDDILKDTIASMRSKWLKYFHEIPDLFLVAKLLDPRVKEDGLEELLNMYYEALYDSNDITEGEEDRPNSSVIVGKTKSLLMELFKEYRIQFGDGDVDTSDSSDVGSSQGVSNPIHARLLNFYDIRSQKRQRGSSNNPYGEVERYLTTTFEGLGFGNQSDLLYWWSRRAASFPVLAIIAKEIFACPASTVSVEQAFSVGGYTLDVRRSRLTVENLENQMLLEDWTKADKRKQEVDYEEDEEGGLLFESSTSGTGSQASDE